MATDRPLLSIIFFIFIFFIHGFTAVAEEIGTPDVADIEYPDDEPPSREEVELGKVLFFDTRLSVNNKMSCATCHNPDLGFGEGMGSGFGTMGNRLGRNTPHLYNLAWNVSFFWDGRAASLEEQALGPIEAPGEMNMPLAELVNKLKSVPFYQEQFSAVYGVDSINKENIARAIAAFERSLISKNSAFDQYKAGNKFAMSPAAIRGMALFNGKAQCINCHDGPNFTDNSYHNIGVNDNDRGRYEVDSDAASLGAFKTPGLRNILLTAPYMHNGSLKDLEAVIRFYNRGGDKKDNIDKLMKPLNLTEEEIFDLIAFIGALTDPVKIQRPDLP